MSTRKVDEKLIDKALSLVDKARKIVITCHISPDGDAVGSSLALCHFLRQRGKQATVVVPNAFPAFLKWMDGARDILVYKDNRYNAVGAIREADLIFSLDYNELKRLGADMETSVRRQRCKRIQIDHHLDPEPFADVSLSYPQMSSACLLLFYVLSRWNGGAPLSRNIAECLYTGMMTDTGAFTYNSNAPDIYTVISELIKVGIDKDAIYDKVFNAYSADRFRMLGYCLTKMEILPEYGTAIIAMSRDELNRFNYRKGDTEGFVNQPLAIKGIFFSAFLKEEDSLIKISLRSQGDFPTNIVARDNFNGGGHLNASGGEAPGETLENVVRRLKEALPKYKNYFDAEIEKLSHD